MDQEVGHHPVDRDLPAPGQAQRALEAYDNIAEQLSGWLRKTLLAHGEGEYVRRAIAIEPFSVQRTDDRIIDPGHAQFRVRTSRAF